VPDNLNPTIDRVEALKPIAEREGIGMPEMALRFILGNPVVSTVIPGMRKPPHVDSNIATSDVGRLSDDLLAELTEHRWERQPAKWSN
jgi:aryl-alcohol dehydrogenase-like predicted oxidoreductase